MKKKHILLIEDNEGDILLTQEAFSESNLPCEISVEKNGLEGLKYLEDRVKKPKEFPDLILLDINLPKMNGHEVLARIKSDPQMSSIPVIIFTTSSSPSDVQTAYENHANSYVTKPTNMEEYGAVILAIENYWLKVAQLPKFI